MKQKAQEKIKSKRKDWRTLIFKEKKNTLKVPYKDWRETNVTRNGEKCIKTGDIRMLDVILSGKKSTEKCPLGLSNKITDNNLC